VKSLLSPASEEEVFDDSIRRRRVATEILVGRETLRVERARVADVVARGAEDDEPCPAEWL
jgi:hypothetical protein